MQLLYSFKQVKNLIYETSLKGQMFRFIYFLSLYFLFRFFLLLLDSTYLGIALLKPSYEKMSFFITHFSCSILRVFYPDIHTSVNHIIYISGYAHIQMLPGCTGISHLIRLGLILLFYPIPWLNKAIAFLPSMLIILFAATLHFLLLILIAYHYPELYEFAHNYFTRSLFFGFIFLCWLFWERSFKRSYV
jgi:exosortase/archaeosortase family protein